MARTATATAADAIRRRERPKLDGAVGDAPP
jgi:hypothetical protein